MPSANGLGNINRHRSRRLGAIPDARLYAWFTEPFSSADRKEATAPLGTGANGYRPTWHAIQSAGGKNMLRTPAASGLLRLAEVVPATSAVPLSAYPGAAQHK